MTWIILAALIVVFIIGYRILTSDTRKAIDSLAHLLRVKPMLIESMIQEMGGRQSQTFIRMLNNGYTEEMHQAAYLLFIYLTFIKQADDEQIALCATCCCAPGCRRSCMPSTPKRRCFTSPSWISMRLNWRSSAAPTTSVSTAKRWRTADRVPRAGDRLQEHAVEVARQRFARAEAVCDAVALVRGVAA